MSNHNLRIPVVAHTHLNHRAFKKQYGIVGQLEGVEEKRAWSIECKEVIVLIDGIIYIAENKTGFQLFKDYKVSVDLTTASPTITKVVDIPPPPKPSWWLLRFPLYTTGGVMSLLWAGPFYKGPFPFLCIAGVCWAIDYFVISPKQKKAMETYEEEYTTWKRNMRVICNRVRHF